MFSMEGFFNFFCSPILLSAGNQCSTFRPGTEFGWASLSNVFSCVMFHYSGHVNLVMSRLLEGTRSYTACPCGAFWILFWFCPFDALGTLSWFRATFELRRAKAILLIWSLGSLAWAPGPTEIMLFIFFPVMNALCGNQVIEINCSDPIHQLKMNKINWFSTQRLHTLSVQMAVNDAFLE